MKCDFESTIYQLLENIEDAENDAHTRKELLRYRERCKYNKRTSKNIENAACTTREFRRCRERCKYNKRTSKNIENAACIIREFRRCRERCKYNKETSRIPRTMLAQKENVENTENHVSNI
ncbi:hypothetical protein PoB_002469600 [Plakobranchus ocellatus]|uniref:Uncharacterized protein n=1 Tax=Plakobranchus ocellatus TaxID=259542 RepID=A0AAV3ZQE8_9GAST|nr:hypothetical protein PoB_002469600 [Plakobranchus ocellatus]